jgi:uncharacterized membrane protein (DUF2068 family)
MAAAPAFDPRSKKVSKHSSGSGTAGRRTSAHHGSDGRLLRLIAVFKFFKAASLIALCLGAFRMLHQDLGERLEHWVRALRLDPGNHYVEIAIARASNLTPGQIKKLGLAGLLYAALFLVEGTGLWLQKRWGEWVTVVITGTLIPVEVYEIVRHPSGTKVAVMIFNIAVVGYLIYRIRTIDRAR